MQNAKVNEKLKKARTRRDGQAWRELVTQSGRELGLGTRSRRGLGIRGQAIKGRALERQVTGKRGGGAADKIREMTKRGNICCIYKIFCVYY
jgi:hypothetical protein